MSMEAPIVQTCETASDASSGASESVDNCAYGLRGSAAKKWTSLHRNWPNPKQTLDSSHKFVPRKTKPFIQLVAFVVDNGTGSVYVKAILISG